VQTYLQKPPGTFELEARFGEGALSRSDYKRIGHQFVKRGFKQVHEEKLLRLSLPGGYRVVLRGLSAIQGYWTAEKLPSSAQYERKRRDKTVDSDYGIRLSLSEEHAVDSSEAQRFREKWSNLTKQHRLIDRIRLAHPDYPHWVVDFSTVKSCYNKVYRTADCALLTAGESYEVEIEAVKLGDLKDLMRELKTMSTIALTGIQNTLYPVTKTRLAKAAEDYRALAKIDPALAGSMRFLGPNMVTMQLEHLYPTGPPTATEETEEEEVVADRNVASILHGYAVTDKADGVRKMLFVDDEGDVFFITSRMVFENCNMNCPALAGSLFDGEFVDVDKEGATIDLYAVFDAYFYKREDIRMLPLLGAEGRSRYELVREAVRHLEAFHQPIVAKSYHAAKDVHAACASCLAAVREYATDGIILIPVAKGVGVNLAGQPPPNRSFTWNLCLKWKPYEQTTIDFKILLAETLDDRCVVHFGILCRSGNSWDRPQVALLEQTTAQPSSIKGVRPFLTDEDPYSHTGYIKVENGNMVTSSGDTIYPGSIVECAYQSDQPDMWRWTPIRVRGDKDVPNAFETAHNNWKFLLNPVTAEMLTGKSSAPKDDRYYTGDRTSMRSLRLYHGFVKHQVLGFAVGKLRNQASTTAINLCDFGVGQGGDLWRWRSLNLAFVLGIDLFAHNINNKQSGACIRYLKSATRASQLRVLFAVGDMCQDLFQTAQPTKDDLDQLILMGVFGRVQKSIVDPFPNLAAHYNSTFQLSAAMFSIHYAFKTVETLTQFVKNVAVATAVGGYFVGTTWDGHKIFNLLKDLPKHGQLSIDEVLITKLYSTPEFTQDEAGVAVGYGIEVVQSTFNASIEYLVDTAGLETLMRSHGFNLVALRHFDTYYKEYLEDKHPPLSEAEQQLSFANQTFVFQKIE